MRIKAPAAKVGYLLVVAVGITLTVIPLAAISFELGFAWALASVVASVVVAARTFRAAAESDAPRPWWKMTGGRGSGVLLSALFFFQGIVTCCGATASSNPPFALIGGAVALVVAAFFLNSAIRIRPVSVSA